MEDVKVKVIPAKPKLKVVWNTPIKRRVCGYARVSTDNEEQADIKVLKRWEK